MKSLADDPAAASLNEALASAGAPIVATDCSIQMMTQAKARTGLDGREVPGADDPALRFQLGETVREDVEVFSMAIVSPHRHVEKNAKFFKLVAWGSSWAGAVACFRRNK